MHYFLVVLYETVMSRVLSLPRFRLLNAFKSQFLRALGADVGLRVVLYPGVWIMPIKNVSLGNDVDLALGVTLTGSAPISIGDRTLVGYGTRIISSNHHVPQSGRIFGSGHDSAPVAIGADCWIGANCVILPGVQIGVGSVVGAGSVVTRDVASGAIVAGVPARQVKMRA